MNDPVVLDLVGGSPADRRGMDYAVLLHLALLCHPCPGPADSDGAWRSLRPVTGAAASRAAIALAVLGDGGGPAAQSVGQCLRRLRGAGDKHGRHYDPPLLAAVDRRGRHLPPDEGAGGDGYRGYVPLRVLGTPGPALARDPGKSPADPLDETGLLSGGVQQPPQESSLDEHCGRVQRPPRNVKVQENNASRKKPVNKENPAEALFQPFPRFA